MKWPLQLQSVISLTVMQNFIMIMKSLSPTLDFPLIRTKMIIVSLGTSIQFKDLYLDNNIHMKILISLLLFR